MLPVTVYQFEFARIVNHGAEFEGQVVLESCGCAGRGALAAVKCSGVVLEGCGPLRTVAHGN